TSSLIITLGTAGSCSPTWPPYATKAHKTNKMSWSSAVSYCKTNHSHIASIMNSTENLAVQSLLSEPAWIGLKRAPWRWSSRDGDGLNFFRKIADLCFIESTRFSCAQFINLHKNTVKLFQSQSVVVDFCFHSCSC
uniref:C-type lectin domain-containing protein n=1 Tax=Myripristis murdjan TaxID=586833 RepID=A0A667WKX1_9TELE